jgi:cellulose synthase/poly-beta-1,6-N-acetylglucosamine synthase-like glycosyltransferase
MHNILINNSTAKLYYIELIFYVSIIAIIYIYFLYPLSIYIISLFCNKKIINSNDSNLFVSLIITAFNEEKHIEGKIMNTILLDYPSNIMQIILVSDGSTDKTNNIVGKFKKNKVELIRISERKGKENAQREALKHAKGEVIVFTDVSTILEKNAIKQIVSNFSDPTIGCVSSEDRVTGKDGKQSGENFYVRYEMWLRKLESKVGSPVGLSGSFFAARKSVCEDFSGEMDSDFRTLLNSVKQGMRGTVDPEAIGYYQDLSDQRREFERKVRTVLRGLTVFFRNIEFLNVFRYGLFSYEMFCHKLLRWLVPFFLIIMFVVNIPLASVSRGFAILLAAQCLFYAIAAIQLFRDMYSSSILFIKIPIYFVTVNASILVAWFRYLTGQRVLVWTPSER